MNSFGDRRDAIHVEIYIETNICSVSELGPVRANTCLNRVILFNNIQYIYIYLFIYIYIYIYLSGYVYCQCLNYFPEEKTSPHHPQVAMVLNGAIVLWYLGGSFQLIPLLRQFCWLHVCNEGQYY